MAEKMNERLRAVRLTIPVMCGYLFLGTAFGATLAHGAVQTVYDLLPDG